MGIYLVSYFPLLCSRALHVTAVPVDAQVVSSARSAPSCGKLSLQECSGSHGYYFFAGLVTLPVISFLQVKLSCGPATPLTLFGGLEDPNQKASSRSPEPIPRGPECAKNP